MLRNDKYSYEVITGTRNEHRFVNIIARFLEEYVDEVKFLETPVSSWEEQECIVETEKHRIECRALPYTLPANIRGKYVSGEYLHGRIALREKPGNKLVIIPFPDEPDDAKYVVLSLYTLGAAGVIFYDVLPGRYRRIVIVGDEDYSFSHGSPPPIPVVSIRKEDAMKIVKDTGAINLLVKTSIRHNSIGRTVVARIHGAGDEEVHVTAHHDHWFTGFSDNMIGVELLLHLAGLYGKTWNGPNLVLISYTAEESGAPYYTSWYWSWGSRYLLELMDKTNELDKIIADINLDAIYTRPLLVNGNPALLGCIDEIAKDYPLVYRGHDYTDFDSFSYTMKGIPALTLHSLPYMKHIYHTDLDDGREVLDKTISVSGEILVKMIECVAKKKIAVKELASHLKSLIGDPVEPELRSLIARIETLDNVIGNQYTSIRIATQLLTRVTYMPVLDGVFSSELLSDIIEAKKLVENINKYIGSRIRLKVVDREQFIDASPTDYNLDELRKALDNAIRQRIIEYHRKLDKLISETLIKTQHIS